MSCKAYFRALRAEDWHRDPAQLVGTQAIIAGPQSSMLIEVTADGRMHIWEPSEYMHWWEKQRKVQLVRELLDKAKEEHEQILRGLLERAMKAV